MNHSLNSTLTLAVAISDESHDQGLPLSHVLRGLEGQSREQAIEVLINAAIKGDILNPSPSIWAMIVDAQEATRLLTKSQSFGPENHFQQHTYLEAANRKLAEAVSWLV